MIEEFPTLTPFECEFDYNKTEEQLLEESKGNVQPGPSTVEGGMVRRKGYLAQFGESVPDAAVDAWCAAYGKRRGTPHETLAVCLSDPSLQRKHPMVSGRRGSAIIVLRGGEGAGRYVNSDWHDDVLAWSANCAFVIFDIEPQPA